MLNERPVGECDNFILNSEEEQTPKFEELSKLILYLQDQANNSGVVRGSAVVITFLVDSPNLKTTLIPIPSTSLKSLEDTLRKLMQLKIDQLKRLFREYRAKLKSCIKTLDSFVESCKFINQIRDMMPKIVFQVQILNDIDSLLTLSKWELMSNPVPNLLQEFLKAYNDTITSKAIA